MDLGHLATWPGSKMEFSHKPCTVLQLQLAIRNIGSCTTQRLGTDMHVWHRVPWDSWRYLAELEGCLDSNGSVDTRMRWGSNFFAKLLSLLSLHLDTDCRRGHTKWNDFQQIYALVRRPASNLNPAFTAFSDLTVKICNGYLCLPCSAAREAQGG